MSRFLLITEEGTKKEVTVNLDYVVSLTSARLHPGTYIEMASGDDLNALEPYEQLRDFIVTDEAR